MMSLNSWKVYLSGEIHSDWRQEINVGCSAIDLPIMFLSPVTNHEASDDCGVEILGAEENDFWKDQKGAGVNAIRTRTLIAKSDIIVIKFGEKFRQWNAAFDAGIASALGKPMIIMHSENLTHALKEIDNAALAVTENPKQVVRILNYAINGNL